MKKTFLLLLMVIVMQSASAQQADTSLLNRLCNISLSTCRIDTVTMSDDGFVIELNPSIQRHAIREETIAEIESEIRDSLGEAYDLTPFELTVFGRPIADFLPNPKNLVVREHGQVVKRLDAEAPAKGLSGKTIAVWPSHGWFYEPTLNRWEWQRARCFSTVEDISSTGYVNTYLIPMLESAGAEVYTPRERDVQKEMIVIDNDGKDRKALVRKGKWEEIGEGYAHAPILYADENPFRQGTYLQISSDKKHDKNYVTYQPTFENGGRYAVYVSWGNDGQKAGRALYEVKHTGGTTRFEVDQRADGRTWYYLGTFDFAAGNNPETGSVTVRASENSPAGSLVSTDAVRFGGGWGRVARGADKMLSGSLAYAEGSRYYLQTAGMPDSVYSPTAFKNDYNDDYRSRSLWVNHLLHEMNVPVDLSFAFHTDAGCTPDSSIIGTLSIYSTYDGDNEYMGRFSNGDEKFINRTLADMVQSQIASDIRTEFNEDWTVRDLRDASYNEAWKPDVPSMLLELLSHQNLADMRYSLDPRFRFAVSRAIYKAMTRFLNGGDCVIQPLQPLEFCITPLEGRRIRLSWVAQPDPLEPTANPTSYRLYTRKGDAGFDNGIKVNGNSIEIELPEWGQQYSFRVTAVNDGGESMPSEELSACLFEGQRPVLIVNGFTRVSAPITFDTGDMSGLAWWDDEGVADGYDTHYVGRQYDFYRSSPWLDDDCPGWGASGSEGFNSIVKGNSFDFTSLHGAALAASGRGFISCSRAAFENPDFDVLPYAAVDLIMGEQRTTHSFNGKEPQFAVYTPELMAQLSTMSDLNIPLLLTGAYVGSDPVIERDTVAIEFMRDKLHFTQRNNHSSQTGNVMPVDGSINRFAFSPCTFTTAIGEPLYRVEAPDALEPAGDGAMRIYRYQDTSMSAGVAYDGEQKIVVLGFPFETIIGSSDRARIMGEIMNFLTENK